MSITVCSRCYTPVVFKKVSQGYFAVCPTHDEDLYQVETTELKQVGVRAISVLTQILTENIEAGNTTIPLGIVNDALDLLIFTNEYRLPTKENSND